MYNFFVLGQIPGTNITITFTMWAELFAIAIVLFAWMHLRRNQRIASPMLQPTIGDNENTLILTVR